MRSITRCTWRVATAEGQSLPVMVYGVACLTMLAILPALSSGDDAQPASSRLEKAWTTVPTVDQQDASLHRGIVYGPDGEPLAGASIYAASTIELFSRRSTKELSIDDLGGIRAVTDEQGRFEFQALDLTWSPIPGERKRWETLLVATKPGLFPGWISTWGEDRTLRSHWHPHRDKPVAIRMSQPRTVSGRFLSPDRKPLRGAKVRLTAIMSPRDRDFDRHVEHIANMSPYSSGIDYAETIGHPQLLRTTTCEATTGEQGEFTLAGLPADHIVSLEVTHPDVRTSTSTVAVREMVDVYTKPHELRREPVLTLLGSGFTHQLEAGVTLRGVLVRQQGMASGPPVAGATIALANQNSPDGMWGEKVTTDAAGRFVLSGLGPDYHGEGYSVAVAGSFAVPLTPVRTVIRPDHESTIEVAAAIPYRLTLTDAAGQPVDREVFSIEVQSRPGQLVRRSMHHFNEPSRVAPGVYEGVVPTGPGAVLVKRNRRDRPVLVDSKGFFEPGRTDWTLEEARYAYGTEWTIVQPAVSETDTLTPNFNAEHSQLELAAIVLTNAAPTDGVLELLAVVIQDEPRQATLVDEAGEPVVGAAVTRQFREERDRDLPATFPLHGLHPQRAEFLTFVHSERRLVGFAEAKMSTEPLSVVLRPVATIKGRIVDKSGAATSDFGIMVSGAVAPDTMFANRVFGGTNAERGRFEFQVPPGQIYSGELVRRVDFGFSYLTRPTIGHAFGPVTPAAGEVLDLGDISPP
ncbi:MAG: carboxypeptidase-like regulatory domain-containing protein [Planctomycetaceae bacterium]